MFTDESCEESATEKLKRGKISQFPQAFEKNISKLLQIPVENYGTSSKNIIPKIL